MASALRYLILQIFSLIQLISFIKGQSGNQSLDLIQMELNLQREFNAQFILIDDLYWTPWFEQDTTNTGENFDFLNIIKNQQIPWFSQSILVKNMKNKIINSKQILIQNTISNNSFLDKLLLNINQIPVKIEDVIADPNFMKFVNGSIVDFHIRQALNITVDAQVDYNQLNKILDDYLQNKIVAILNMNQKQFWSQTFTTPEESYIFLISLKLIYMKYQTFSKEYTSNSKYYWNITIKEIIEDKDFVGQYDSAKLTEVLSNLTKEFNLSSPLNYDEIDFAIEIALRFNYESLLFNNTEFLTIEEKNEIDFIINLKALFDQFTRSMMAYRYDKIVKNISINAIYDDIEYRPLIPAATWNQIGKFARNITNNSDYMVKINWTEFNAKFDEFVLRFDGNSSNLNTTDDLMFYSILQIENDYLAWKKDRIFNPVPRNITVQSTTNSTNPAPLSTSIFSDMGINIHNGLQPIALLKNQTENYRKNKKCNYECLNLCIDHYFTKAEMNRCRKVICKCDTEENYLDFRSSQLKYFSGEFISTVKTILGSLVVLFAILLFIYGVGKYLNRRREYYNEDIDMNHYVRVQDNEN